LHILKVYSIFISFYVGSRPAL